MQELIYSADGEDFQYESVQEILDNYEDLVAGDLIHVAEKHDADVTTLVDADDITEMLGERAWDNFGECAEDFPDVSKEAKMELNMLLSGWITKNCKVNFWWVRNVKTYVITEEDMKENACE